MTYLRKDMVQECLAEMSVKDILTHPTTGKPIEAKLTFNSIEQSLY